MKRPPKKGQKRKETRTKTLLIDGNALFKVGYHGAIKEVNWKGHKIGGIYQFITVLRKLLNEELYHKVYVFWDGPLSGKLRYEIYSDYKKSRDKCYLTGVKTQEEDPFFIIQRKIVKSYLDEMFIRQIEDEVVEGDDLIAYYTIKQKRSEDITIVTNDTDILQLLDENVRVYLCNSHKKVYITIDNYNNYFDYHYKNAKLIKMIEGDSADDIMGVKNVKAKTLLKHFPELKERVVSLSEILKKAKEIQDDRLENKKKPLQGIQNLIEGKTDGIQGSRLYEINERIIDLKNPILTKECKKLMDYYIDAAIDPENRNMKNVYQYVKRDGLSRLIGTNNLSEYFLPFKKLADREKKKMNNLIKECDYEK